MKNEYGTKRGWWVLAAGLALGAPLAAQVSQQGSVGNLENDIREDRQARPSRGLSLIEERPYGAGGVSLEDDIVVVPEKYLPYKGQVLDGGTLYVDLFEEPGLEISFGLQEITEKPRRAEREEEQGSGHVRLFGGTPGNVGAIVLSAEPPGEKDSVLRFGAAIAGVFAADGTLVVDVPADLAADGFHAQGLELDGGAPSKSKILQVGGIDGSLQVNLDDEAAWGVEEISNQVYRAVKNLSDDEAVRIRFVGTAGAGSARGPFDLTVLLGKVDTEKGGFAMYVGPELAQLTRLGSESGTELHFRRAEDLAGAVVTVALLQAFADVDRDLGWAHVALDAERSKLAASSQSMSSGHVRQASAPTVTIGRFDGEEEEGAAFGLGEITQKPRRAGDHDQPERTRGPQMFGGELGDVTKVDPLFPEPVLETKGLSEITDKPRRAGDQVQPPKQSGGAKQFQGPLAGSLVRDAAAESIEKARQAFRDLESLVRELEARRNNLLQHTF